MSSLQLYKYSGAGNDFIVIADGVPGGAPGYDASGWSCDASAYRDAALIGRICDRRGGFRAADGRTGADGLMILSLPEGGDGKARTARLPDFRMEYFNSDGSGGMMCGNGGRCIVAFADFLGLKPSAGNSFVFEAPDGLHSGEIISRQIRRCTVRLKMIDAFGLRRVLGGWFLNTGTRHFVTFVEDVEKVDVEAEGPRLRHAPEFAPEGANVNFVSPAGDGSLKIRTFEKGVEAETLACGTGITAAAIAAWYEGVPPTHNGKTRAEYLLHARTDELSVDFIPSCRPGVGLPPAAAATEVYLTGPAERI